jgi:hypothetical protein
MSNPALEDEVRKVLDEYKRAWEAGEWHTVEMLYHVPSITVREDGSVRCFQSGEKLQEFFRGVDSARNRAAKLGPSRYHALTIQPIGARSVLATVNWQNFLMDGKLNSEWRQSYNLAFIDGRWQILVSTFHLD